MKYKICYALKDRKRLALSDGRLPIYWMRKIAQMDNHERFNDEGLIVKVVVQEYKDFWKPIDKEKILSWLNTTVEALEKEQHQNLDGDAFARGELNAFKTCRDLIKE